jgi:predicted nucleic acid-binding protein
VIVVDACTWVEALVVGGARADATRDMVVGDPRWVAPAHMPLEVIRTLRRAELRGELTAEQAARCADLVGSAKVELIVPGDAVLARVWALHHTMSTYDAPYVAVAEAFGVPLVTIDLRLARAAEKQGVEVVVPA